MKLVKLKAYLCILLAGILAALPVVGQSANGGAIALSQRDLALRLTDRLKQAKLDPSLVSAYKGETEAAQCA